MRRPPGLWILLSAGVLWLSLQDVYGIRATALIFGKSSTSTTTEASSSALPEEISNNETASNNGSLTSSNTTENANSTSPVLTGNPQIDYIWDPNLPRVLNGYNLSEYPFYERVPDEVIEFKCDGLHDGFYASIPHKCQVYHHCLFGTRYDFLCANYTAFDQKTFICQFVSEVDCVNSKKFWHRNDALYEAASTTTTAPLNLRAAIYTTVSPVDGDPGAPRRPAGAGARRPYRPNRRRRPQFEYYDDEYDDDEYYDERPRSNRGRKRPRPRPRPAYEDDDYEEYDDERFESRRAGSRRRPNRDRRRNKDKKKPEYDEDMEEVDDKFEDEDFIPDHKRQKPDNRRKQPIDDHDDEDTDRNIKAPSEKRRPSSEKREQSSVYDRNPPRKGLGNRRPAYDEYEDELPQSDDSRSYEERPRKKQKGNKEEATSSDGRPIIKSATGTIYDRPRVAPKINLPVPKNAADKYAYKAAGSSRTTTTSAPPMEEEYDDEEYEEKLPKRSSNRERRPLRERTRDKTINEDSKSQSSGSRSRTRKPESEESVEKSTPKPKYGAQRNRYRPSSSTIKSKPLSQQYDDDDDDDEYLDEIQERRPSLKNNINKSSSSTSISTSTTTTTTTTEPPRKEPVMRIIKRPFLPSRGGSPYSARGLHPVGLKAVENESQESRNEDTSVNTSKDEDTDYIEDTRETPRLEEGQNNRKPFFKPSPVLLKVPVRPKYTPPSGGAQEIIDLEPSRQQNLKTKSFLEPRTTLKPKIVEKDPLDLNEYDVTLNDALNPALPNLPVRAFPTGFSSASDYTNYNTYSRPRYVLEPVVSPTNQNYVYPNKVVRTQQRYEGAVQGGQYSTINGGYRPQQGQKRSTRVTERILN